MLRLLACVLTAVSVDTTPMTKLVTLLTDLENELKEQGAKEGDIFKKFSSWSAAEIQESKATISDAESKIADLQSFLHEQESFRAKMTSEVNEIVRELASNERELKEASAFRSTEHQQYLQNEEAFVGSLDEVGRALEVLSADTPGARPSVSEIQQAVRHVLERSNLSFSRRERTTLDTFFRTPLGRSRLSFLQVNQLQSNLGPLIQLLENIRKDTETNRNSATQEEQQAQTAFELMKRSLASEIDAGNKALSTKKTQIASSSERSAAKNADLTETERLRAETSTFLDNVVAERQQKTLEWTERTKLRSDALTAIGEARRILISEAAKRIQASNPTAFIQTSKTLQHVKRHIRKHPLLALLATSTTLKLGAKDPFSSVRRMVEEMITRLLNAAADEADQKSWCDEEMKKTRGQKSAKEKDILKLTSRIDEMEATLAQLDDELAQLNRDLGDMTEMTGKASEVRIRERTQSMLSIQQYKEAQSLLQNALGILKDFYSDKDSLIEISARDKKGPDKASGVIGLLEVAVSDFQKLQQEAEMAESVAEKEFKELMNESKIRKAVFTKNVDYKSTEKVKLEGALHRAKADRQGYQRELAAVKEYFKKLEPSCTVKTDSFEERAARRKQEIESLQEALRLLNGDTV